MSTPHKCPICNGRGIVQGGFYGGPAGTTTISLDSTEKCRACNGKGLIWEKQKDETKESGLDMAGVRRLLND